MAAQILIPAQTGAFESVFFPINQDNLPATIEADGLQGSETIPIMRSLDDGITSTTISHDGTNIELSALNNTVTINSPMLIRVDKGVTANPVTVGISSGRLRA